MSTVAPTRDELLAMTLRDAERIHLCLRPECLSCDVPHRVWIPCRWLVAVKRLNPALTVREVVARLRCSACGGTRVRVTATDDPAAGAHGGKAPTWRFVIRDE